MSLITNTSDCPWWVRSWFTSCSKAEMSAANSWSGSPSRATRGSSRSKPHLKSQATGVSRPFRSGPHPDRVQLQRGHPVVVHQLPELRQVLHQRRDDLLRRPDVAERVRHHEGLQPGQRLERHDGDVRLRQLLDVHAAAVGQRHRRRPEVGVVGDREVDLVLGRHPGLEGHAVRLGMGVAVPVLAEIEPLLLGQRLLQRPRLADQPGLALLADPAAEHRLDEDQPVPVDQVLDRILGSVRPEHLGGREVDVGEQSRAVEQAVQLHRDSIP